MPAADAIADDEDTTPFLPRTGWLVAASSDSDPSNNMLPSAVARDWRILLLSKGLTGIY